MGCPDVMRNKLDVIYCVLVVAVAVLAGIRQCSGCGNPKAP